MKQLSIVLGVSGCIAAYKSAEIVRRFHDANVRVKAVMTAHARHFIGPLTLQTLTGQRVITDMFAPDAEADIEHIALTFDHDLLLVAPATANIMAKFAHGIADDFLSTLYLSMTKPVVLAPAMNVEMWGNPSVQENAAILKKRGVHFVDPEEGYLACGVVGAGRLADPQRIVGFTLDLLRKDAVLAGKRFLIAAGPTVEQIDPVRHLSNRSSGKMGYALAVEALRRGAEVTLISGPVALAAPAGAVVLPVRSTAEMRQALLGHFDACDVAIMAAAVCDYMPEQTAPQKIKKTGNGSWNLALVPTPDILAELGERKKHQVLVGFAAESEEVVENARRKLKSKRLDLIVANDITLPDSGFDSDYNTVALLSAAGSADAQPRLPKVQVAQVILDRITDLLEKS